MSARHRMLAGIALAMLAVVALAFVIHTGTPPAPPAIHGVLLADPVPLPPFRLLDDRGDSFTNRDLAGRWHLLTYGFTSCPDVCPTTLSQLATVVKQLGPRADDLEVLFYTVDYRRDTAEQLAAYLPFFNSDFVGLTHGDDPDNPHLPFEQGLGIAARLVPGDDPGSADYQVVHGIAVYLLNPRGELQAVFEPDDDGIGVPAFHADTLVRDYLALRRYLSGGTTPGGSPPGI